MIWLDMMFDIDRETAYGAISIDYERNNKHEYIMRNVRENGNDQRNIMLKETKDIS